MALEISPRSQLDDMVIGEEYAFGLDLGKELGAKTVDSYTYKIYDSTGAEATLVFGGGSSISDMGVITFGLKAVSAGTYTLKFIVTCNDLLPDGLTPYEFYITMTVNITV